MHSPPHALAQPRPSLLAADSLREKPVVLLSSSFLRSTAAEQAAEQAEKEGLGTASCVEWSRVHRCSLRHRP